jgi:ATP phosphoribosyltransferase
MSAHAHAAAPALASALGSSRFVRGERVGRVSSSAGRGLARRSRAAPAPLAPVASIRQQQSSTTVYRKSVDARDSIRMGIPSKGRMAEDTMDLLGDCQLKVRKINPRQYAAEIPNVPGMEVWFQRATDVVRKLISGDIDIGIVGYDMLREIGNEDEDLVVVHDALGFGGCHLAVAVPQAWEDVHSLRDLLSDKRWSKERPLRVVTAYMNLAEQFFAEQGFEHVELSTADGALEAAPAMGAADCILDLVSSGTTLRENNLKQIEGGRVLESQGVLVASRTALLERPGTLEIIHEMLERLEAHLRADGLFMVTANVRGTSAEEVATRLANDAGQLLRGLQGPTISPIYTPSNDGTPSKEGSFYAVSVAVPKTRIYETVKDLRKNGGSGVLSFPLTYVFDEEPPRWNALMNNLGLDPKNYDHLKVDMR